MRTGDVIAERFELEHLAGAGGMGEVWSARDRLSGARVALKRMRGMGDETTRFVREAAMLASVSHGAIVQYVAHGEDRGEPWLAMEWLDGEDLGARLARAPVGLHEACTIARRIAEALGAAHARGVIHRDLKPSNVLLVGGAPSAATLLDFGIALASRGDARLTGTGLVLGTAQYMAPEQARGDRALDARVDVWALGCVLFEMLVGRPPFEGSQPIAVLAKILLEDPPRLAELRPELPEPLVALVQSMLSRDPANRPADARQLADALDALELGPDPGRASRPLQPGSAPGPHLTQSEQRVICLLMTGSLPIGDATAKTVAHDTVGTAQTQRTGRDALALEAELRETVVAYGGRLELLASGAAVATFTASRMPTDQAVRAARCALAVRALIEDVPVALVAGRAVVTGRLPVGAVIERAAELLARHARGVQLDALTAGLLERRFRVAERDDGRLLLGAERDATDSARTLLGAPSPFVGRERELAQLEALLAEARDEPVARAVLVTSPPGGGKSRLLLELLARASGWEILIGRGDPLRAGAAFSVLSEAIARSAGIAPGEPLEVRRRKLRQRAAALALAPRTAAFLGELARTPFAEDEDESLRAARRDPAMLSDALQRAFLDFLDAQCANAPVLLVLEDLQWGDAATVRFVEHALPALAERPIVVLALARPEVHDAFPELFRAHEGQELRLAKLTRRAQALVVRAALGEDTPDALVQRLTERAEGNPFFLEELLRAHVAQPDGALPESVVAMVQARLDALDGESRRALRAASIFGRRFSRRGVLTLLGANPTARAETDVLEPLAEAELIARADGARLPDDAEYVFRQDLVRAAAYAMLTEPDRALGHALAARFLEQAGEPDADVLAEHSERGAERARAAFWWARAAEHALGGNDLPLVLAKVERGRVGEPDAETSALLDLVEAEAHRWRGDYARALACATRAAAGLPPGSSRWFAAVTNLCLAAARRAELDTLVAFSEAARDVVAAPDALAAQAECLCRVASAHLGLGRFDETRALLGRVARLGVDAQLEPRIDAWTRTLGAALHLRDGDVVAYLEGTERAARAFELAGDARNACNHRVRLGYGLTELGDFTRAEVELRAGLTQAERLGLPLVRAYALQNLGNVLRLLGRTADARSAELRAIALAEELADASLEVGARLYLAQVALAEARPEEAAREAERVLAHVEPAHPFACVALALRSRAQLAEGDVQGALASSADAVARAAHLADGEALEPLVQVAHAEALTASGQSALAQETWNAAFIRLSARAHRILDDAVRARFLGNVPEHARIVSAARA